MRAFRLVMSFRTEKCALMNKFLAVDKIVSCREESRIEINILDTFYWTFVVSMEFICY